jgi:hypothetical protein
MPLEGHYERVNTPLRRLTARERNAAVVVGLATLLAVVALILIPGVRDSEPAPGPGCIATVVGGRVGGEPVRACGTEAERVCARSAHFDDERARKIGDVCREAGIRFASAGG